MFIVSPAVLQTQAARYVSGELTAPEREALEVVLEFQEELRQQVAALQEVVTGMVVTETLSVAAPPLSLKARILGAVAALPAKAGPEALVATNPAGAIEWVNPAFTAMCGYTLAELKGRKPGELLQGPETDAAAIARIRTAMRSRQACRETMVNYHKNGTSYRADISIAPVLGDDGEPLWFVARERKLADVKPDRPESD
jgi:PAS domain S-box-containing protein